MKLSFLYKKEDLIKGYYSLNRKKIICKSIVLLLMSLFIGNLLWGTLLNAKSVLTASIIFFLFEFYLLFNYRRQEKLLLQKSQLFFEGPVILEINNKELSVEYAHLNKKIFIRWCEMKEVKNNEYFVLFYTNKKTFLTVPSTAFNDNSYTKGEFIDYARKQIWNGKNINNASTINLPSYFLISLVPFGGIITLYKALQLKNKKLLIAGLAGCIWTLLICCLLWMMILKNQSISILQKDGLENIVRKQIIIIKQDLESYKKKNGTYPKKLNQLHTINKVSPIYDPLQSNGKKKLPTFNYRLVNGSYILFSAGKDNIPNTKDDIF